MRPLAFAAHNDVTSGVGNTVRIGISTCKHVAVRPHHHIAAVSHRKRKHAVDGMLGERIIRIEEHHPLPRGRAQSRVASRGDSGMGDRFRTNADQCRIPIRDRCRFECRLTIEYNHRFDTEATALLPLQTVHAIMQRLQRGAVDGMITLMVWLIVSSAPV